MTEEYVMMQDIIKEHKDRMEHLKKYYPFFRLTDNTFTLYKEGKFSGLDMGYITMAILRFFIDENNIKDKDVSYHEYDSFLQTILRRDFGLNLEREEEKELISYIFEKILNEGKPFSYVYFDPMDRCKKTFKVKFLESKMEEGKIYYAITSEAIEFYLDTKEIKEESTITVEQLLLAKLIDTQNFKGGIEVVKRINREVDKLKVKKNEVLRNLHRDVFQGKVIYENFVGEIMKWFDEEQRLFRKNTELIEIALEKVELDKKGNENHKFYAMMDEVYTLELEIKKAMFKHSELLSMCTSMQLQVDEVIKKSKLSTLRSSFDFMHGLSVMMEKDDARCLEHMVLPLLDIKKPKWFPLSQTEQLLSLPAEVTEENEKISEGKEEVYVYEDEVEDARISDNFEALIVLLLEKLKKENHFSLEDLNKEYTLFFGSQVLKNADYYTFLIHMCQKDRYNLDEIRKKPDTFFEELIYPIIQEKEDLHMTFCLVRKGDETIQIAKVFEISNIEFERVE